VIGGQQDAMSTANRTRILFADDEPNMRSTMAAILEGEGFEVTTASTVAEALRAINVHAFDALVSDLNIGEPGDGFTIVSAMRRTHPNCVNFILTGYPAFESALQAIRNQVDDYLVKPADVRELMTSLKSKLNSPRGPGTLMRERLADFLRENADQIAERALAAMKSDERLSTLPLTDAQRLEHVPGLLNGIIKQLDAKSPDDFNRSILQEGARHGEMRRSQRYSEEMLIDDVRLLDASIYDTVQDGLLRLELSSLIPGLKQMNLTMAAHLKGSLLAFHREAAA
jgi:ActR/RegA family two-component response regulator